MIIKTTNEITNGVFSTILTVDSFGSDTLSGEEELNLLNNYSCKLRYKDLSFIRRFKVVDNELVIVDETDGTTGVAEVELAVTDMTIPVNKNFKAEYKIALNKIKDEEISDVLTTKELICEAKCKTFADTVKEGLKVILDEIRNKATNFEGTSEEMI